MQDIHLIGDARVFTATDRRLRQTHLQNQALKCPRCDSLNTKFCYYNNYNLSQPRHFCKSCRRYWTKGGVLRNVPVGGGCRKSSKRSSSSKLSTAADGYRNGKPIKTNNSNSSSESSSLTGAAVAAAADPAAAPSSPAATPPSAEGVSSSFDALFGFGDRQYIFPQIRNPNFTSELLNIPQGNDGGCFNFATMMSSTANNDPTDLSASYDVVSSHGMNQPHRQLEQWKLGSDEAKLDNMAGAAGGYIIPTVQMDQSSNLGCQPLSWQEQEEEEEEQQQMFGLNSAVDQVYWSQHEWSNSDNPNPHLYLP